MKYRSVTAYPPEKMVKVFSGVVIYLLNVEPIFSGGMG